MQRTLVTLGLLLLLPAGFAQPKPKNKPKPLDDTMLDRVTAAGVSATDLNGVVNFAGQVPTANGLVTSAGTLSLESTPFAGATVGTLNLSGNAQQNLSSLININAVNSQLNVLLNLNITINSTVGSVLQSNLSGKH
jgi:hypothetical protein